LNQRVGERWLWILLFNVSFSQASIYVMRPMITYRALENGASSFEIGLIAALYALVPLLIAVRMGRWIGKIGEVPLLFAGSMTFVLLALSFTFLNNFIALGLLTSLAGIAHLSNVAASQSMVALRSEDSQQDRNFGFFSFATSSGHTFGPILGALVAGSAGALPRSSSSAFFLAAFFGIISIIPVLIVRDLHQKKGQPDRDKADQITARTVLRRDGMKGAVWTSLAVSAANDVLVVILPLVGAENGISPVAIGVILSLRSAASMISRFSLGFLTKRIGSFNLLIFCVNASAALLLLTQYARNVILLGISMVLVGLLLGTGQPLTMAIVSRQSPIEERAMAISVRLFGNRLGQFIIPIASGALSAQFGSYSIFVGLAVLVGSAGVVSLRVSKRSFNQER
jgi:MFS family permease